jgi:hypothetical protein
MAPKDPGAWFGMNPRKWLYFHGVNHLTVEGGGTINGMGQKWWARSCKTNSTNVRIHVLLLQPVSFKDYIVCIDLITSVKSSLILKE